MSMIFFIVLYSFKNRTTIGLLQNTLYLYSNKISGDIKMDANLKCGYIL